MGRILEASFSAKVHLKVHLNNRILLLKQTLRWTFALKEASRIRPIKLLARKVTRGLCSSVIGRLRWIKSNIYSIIFNYLWLSSIIRFAFIYLRTCTLVCRWSYHAKFEITFLGATNSKFGELVCFTLFRCLKLCLLYFQRHTNSYEVLSEQMCDAELLPLYNNRRSFTTFLWIHRSFLFLC